MIMSPLCQNKITESVYFSKAQHLCRQKVLVLKSSPLEKALPFSQDVEQLTQITIATITGS